MSQTALFLVLGIVAFLIMLYRESAYKTGIALVHRGVGIFAILFILLPALFYFTAYVFKLAAGTAMITYPESLALSAVVYLTYYFVYKFWKNPPK